VCKVQENEPVAIESHQITVIWMPEDIEQSVVRIA